MTTSDEPVPRVEPVLHALRVEPRVARPGEIVRAVFRARNRGAAPTAAGTVAFVLGEGLEPIGPAVLAVAPALPGDDVVAETTARLAGDAEDGARCLVQAVLTISTGADAAGNGDSELHRADDAADDATLRLHGDSDRRVRALGTNACEVDVRCRPVLDGGASGTFVEALGPERVRVRVVVTNEGDGTARDVRVVVPVPAGCVRDDGVERDAADGDSEIVTLAALAAGASMSAALTARIVVPSPAIVCDAAFVEYAGGQRSAIPPRAAVETQPSIAVPEIALTAARRALDVAVDVRNDGWADARDLSVRIMLPPPLRLADGALVVDGVPVGVRAATRRNPERSDAGRAVSSDGALTPHASVRSAHGERARPFATAVLGRLKGDGDSIGVTVDVGARSTVRIACRAVVPLDCPPCTVAVRSGDARAEAAFVREPVREVRLRVQPGTISVEAGQAVTMSATIVNAGDVEETLQLALDDAGIVRVEQPSPVFTVAPGCVKRVEFAVRAPDGGRDGDVMPVTVIARDVAGGDREGTGEYRRVARCGTTFVLRDRVWLRVDDVVRSPDGRTTFQIRNAGTTVARGLTAVFGDDIIAIGDIAPGSASALAVADALTTIGGVVRAAGRDVLRLEPPLRAEHRAAEAALHGPGAVFAGSAFEVAAVVRLDAPAGVVRICLPAATGMQYVAGSTTIDGHALLDDCGGSPLDGDGLLLHDVPAGARLRAGCSFFAHPASTAESVGIGATVTADGEPCDVAPLAVTVHARDPFAVRPHGLPYHLDANALELVRSPDDGGREPLEAQSNGGVVGGPDDDIAAEPHPDRAPSALDNDTVPGVDEDANGATALPRRECAPVERHIRTAEPFAPALPRDTVTFAFALHHERVEEIVRFVAGASGTGLVAHVLALRALFPDGVGLSDGVTAAAFGAARQAVYDVFDRLFVKLRIPGFVVACDDVEDELMRAALVAALERAVTATHAVPVRGAYVRVERASLREALDTLARARLGAPAALRALLAVVPVHVDGDDPLIGAALARYVTRLDGALARYETVPLELFEDALAHRDDGALDDARSDLLAALYARNAAAVAC